MIYIMEKELRFQKLAYVVISGQHMVGNWWWRSWWYDNENDGDDEEE